MNAIRPLLLVGSLLILSVGGYAVIHSMNTEVEVPSVTDETSRLQAPAAKIISLGTHAQESKLFEGNKVALIEDVRALQTEFIRLKKEIAALKRRRLASERAIPSSNNDATYPDNEDNTEPRDLSQEEQNEQVYQSIEAMDADFNAETVDTRWSPEATEFIQQTFDVEELAGTEVADIQCRATRCRIEVSHENSADREVFGAFFPLLVGSMLPYATVNYIQEDDGTSRTVIHLDREG